jgi:hypothetical protein
VVGITLTPEQIRSAPPEVRRWLEEEIATSLGLRVHGVEDLPSSGRVVAVSLDEARPILASIRGTLPVVNVFFELGRKGERPGPQGLVILSLSKIFAHTRLSTIEQVIDSVDFINTVTQKVRQDASCNLCLVDPRGLCVVAAQTQDSIARLWQEIALEHGLPLHGAEAAPERGAAPSFEMDGPVPASAVHFGSYSS